MCRQSHDEMERQRKPVPVAVEVAASLIGLPRRRDLLMALQDRRPPGTVSGGTARGHSRQRRFPTTCAHPAPMCRAAYAAVSGWRSAERPTVR